MVLLVARCPKYANNSMFQVVCAVNISFFDCQINKRLPVTEKLRTIIINGIVFCPYYHFGAKRETNIVISFHITSATHQRIEYPNFKDVIPSAK